MSTTTLTTTNEARIEGLEKDLADMKGKLASFEDERMRCSPDRMNALDGLIASVNLRIAAIENRLPRLHGQQYTG